MLSRKETKIQKYFTLLQFVSIIDKDYGSLKCFNTANTSYIITLHTILDTFAKKTKTVTISKFDELMFGKVDSGKKVLVVSISFPRSTNKREIQEFKDILLEHSCKLVSFNEKTKKIVFEINKKEYLYVNLRY